MKEECVVCGKQNIRRMMNYNKNFRFLELSRVCVTETILKYIPLDIESIKKNCIEKNIKKKVLKSVIEYLGSK